MIRIFIGNVDCFLISFSFLSRSDLKTYQVQKFSENTREDNKLDKIVCFVAKTKKKAKRKDFIGS